MPPAASKSASSRRRPAVPKRPAKARRPAGAAQLPSSAAANGAAANANAASSSSSNSSTSGSSDQTRATSPLASSGPPAPPPPPKDVPPSVSTLPSAKTPEPPQDEAASAAATTGTWATLPAHLDPKKLRTDPMRTMRQYAIRANQSDWLFSPDLFDSTPSAKDGFTPKAENYYRHRGVHYVEAIGRDLEV
ncbi:MAG: hypothetical protein BJ554DRAFT_5426 [Olpidium bornovanus]|uniref:Uncharacterized protein n=1 Tax=Olpidium bornovanus TaxID=278681 RepID=A0A8H7ZZV1_9FUNG|nr:MAG: hypothetical protein BJ554DRAFT_5426 [Olpidium bornovanus]